MRHKTGNQIGGVRRAVLERLGRIDARRHLAPCFSLILAHEWGHPRQHHVQHLCSRTHAGTHPSTHTRTHVRTHVRTQVWMYLHQGRHEHMPARASREARAHAARHDTTPRANTSVTLHAGPLLVPHYTQGHLLVSHYTQGLVSYYTQGLVSSVITRLHRA